MSKAVFYRAKATGEWIWTLPFSFEVKNGWSHAFFVARVGPTFNIWNSGILGFESKPKFGTKIGDCEKVFSVGLRRGNVTVLSTMMISARSFCGLSVDIYHNTQRYISKDSIFCDYLTVNPQSMTHDPPFDPVLKNIIIYLSATCYKLDGQGIDSRWGRNFQNLSRPGLGPTQPPVQWVPGLSRG